MQSGTSNPQLLKYPTLLPLCDSIHNRLCYVIEHYGHEGLSVLVHRRPAQDQVAVICGDWQGNLLDLQGSGPQQLLDHAKRFLNSECVKFINIMRLIKLEQAQFYFSTQGDKLTLVDIQVSLNKFVGPGMLRDIFGKICETQQVIKIEPVDERVLECIANRTGSYSQDIIIKPSRFRMHHVVEDNSYMPLYVESTKKCPNT